MMNKKIHIIGTILLIVITNLISIDLAHEAGYKVGKEEQRSYIRKLEMENDKMEKASRQVLKETIEAFRSEANKQFNSGNYDAYLNWNEAIKTYQIALDSIESYSLLDGLHK